MNDQLTLPKKRFPVGALLLLITTVLTLVLNLLSFVGMMIYSDIYTELFYGIHVIPGYELSLIAYLKGLVGPVLHVAVSLVAIGLTLALCIVLFKKKSKKPLAVVLGVFSQSCCFLALAGYGIYLLVELLNRPTMIGDGVTLGSINNAGALFQWPVFTPMVESMDLRFLHNLLRIFAAWEPVMIYSTLAAALFYLVFVAAFTGKSSKGAKAVRTVFSVLAFLSLAVHIFFVVAPAVFELLSGAAPILASLVISIIDFEYVSLTDLLIYVGLPLPLLLLSLLSLIVAVLQSVAWILVTRWIVNPYKKAKKAV